MIPLFCMSNGGTIMRFDLNRMLYTLTPDEHDPETVRAKLAAHPEVKFVSLTGVDMGGHNTDEKIPVQAFSDGLEKLLAKDVDAALADDATAAGLAAEAIRELAGPGEISAGPRLADALKAQLASKGDFTVVMDKDAGTGFRVRLDGGRVEHDFTGEAVARELAKRLRPDLARLLRD